MLIYANEGICKVGGGKQEEEEKEKEKKKSRNIRRKQELG